MYIYIYIYIFYHYVYRFNLLTYASFLGAFLLSTEARSAGCFVRIVGLVLSAVVATAVIVVPKFLAVEGLVHLNSSKSTGTSSKTSAGEPKDSEVEVNSSKSNKAPFLGQIRFAMGWGSVKSSQVAAAV